MIQIFTTLGFTFSISIVNGIGVFDYNVRNLEYYKPYNRYPAYFDKIHHVRAGDTITFKNGEYKFGSQRQG